VSQIHHDDRELLRATKKAEERITLNWPKRTWRRDASRGGEEHTGSPLTPVRL